MRFLNTFCDSHFSLICDFYNVENSKMATIHVPLSDVFLNIIRDKLIENKFI